MYCDHLGNTLEQFSTLIQRRVYEAYLMGYRVSDEGVLYRLENGKQVPLQKSGKFRYPMFHCRLPSETVTMPAHKYAAYCFYGFASFADFTEAGYLNRDLFDISRRNIILRHAARLTPEQVRRIGEFYSGLAGKKAPHGSAKALADELGVAVSTIMAVRHKLMRADGSGGRKDPYSSCLPVRSSPPEKPRMYRDHFGNSLKASAPARREQCQAYEAWRKGYRVSDEGVLYGLREKPMTLHQAARFPYPSFPCYLPGEMVLMRADKFAAYCFYGFAAGDGLTEAAYLTDDLLDISRRNIVLRPAGKVTG